MAFTGRLVILYGSQTGTAQETAERLYRESKRLHFQSLVSAMDDYDVRNLIKEELVVFVCATTGQGDEPENMVKFWKFLLRKSLPPNSLGTLRFGVLGLGDSSYLKFNFVAKKLHKRLVQLGGIPIQSVGLADDQHDLGPDFVIDPWFKSFWSKALEIYPLPDGLDPISPDVLPEPRFKAISIEDRNGYHGEEDMDITSKEFNQTFPFRAKLTMNRRETSDDHFQDTRLIELDIAGSGIEFEPGDVCMVQPKNLQENVDYFFEIFPQFEKEKMFNLEVSDACTKRPPMSIVPRTTTLLECVENLFDLQAIPRRYFFELLSHFTTDDTEKEKLIEFTTAEGQEELFDYCNRPRRNILEVLYDFRFTTPNIPFDYLFDLFPFIRPRSFSIASSLKVVPQKIQLLVAVVKYRSKLVKPRLGLCSNWLAGLSIGSTVPIWVKKGTFAFTDAICKNPMVMVGPGTGIAPFRAYLSERLLGHKDKNTEMALFFGCRGKEKDFYFKQEWDQMKSEHPNFHLSVAFSRDQEDKVYVQHKILTEEFLIRKLIWELKGSFFIAGSSKQMPDQVTDALKRALKETVGYNDEKVEEYYRQMIAEKRFQTETWS